MVDGRQVRIFAAAGLDLDKPIRKYTKKAHKGKRQIEEIVAHPSERLLSHDDARVAVATRQLADLLKIALCVGRRNIAPDVDLQQAAARGTPIMFDGPRSIACVRQLLDETLCTF